MIKYSNINQNYSEYAWSHFPYSFLAINLKHLKMSGNPAVVMRLVASAYSVAEKAGAIVRKVLHSGDLGIVEKVCLYLLFKVRSVERKHVFFSRNEFILSGWIYICTFCTDRSQRSADARGPTCTEKHLCFTV